MDQNLSPTDTAPTTPPQRDVPQAEPGRQIETAEQNTPHTEITDAQIKTRIDLILREYGLLLGGKHRRNLDHDIVTIISGLQSEKKLQSDPNTACMTVIQELATFYAHQIQHDYIEGDLYGTAVYLAIINELHRAMNAPLPSTFFLYTEKVRKRLIPDSTLERLLDLIQTRMIERPRGEPKNIPHADKSISKLVTLAAQAKQDKNWQLALEYQKAIAERPNENQDPGRALHYLALAYENVGDYEMALATLDRREREFPLANDGIPHKAALREKLQRALDAIDQVAKSESRTKVNWPASYTDMDKNSDLTTCDTAILIAYSRQAQQAKDWKKVVMIQKIVAAKIPDTAITHIVLSHALRQLGKTAEADMVAAKAATCPDYRGEKADADKQTHAGKKRQPDLPPKVLAHEAIAATIAAADSQRTPIAQPLEPKPKKPERELPPSNIDVSSFTNFLETFIAQAVAWQNDAVRGATWKKVPESDKQVLREYLTGPTKWRLQAILKGPGNAVFQSLETIEKHVGRGSVDTSILTELQQRYTSLPDELKTRITNEVKAS